MCRECLKVDFGVVPAASLCRKEYDLLGSISHAAYLQEAKEKNRTEQGGINMCKALQEWMERERREGIEQGEERINTLYMNLLRDSRGEDMQRAIEDKAYRGQLCREYGM